MFHLNYQLERNQEYYKRKKFGPSKIFLGTLLTAFIEAQIRVSFNLNQKNLQQFLQNK